MAEGIVINVFDFNLHGGIGFYDVHVQDAVGVERYRYLTFGIGHSRGDTTFNQVNS